LSLFWAFIFLLGGFFLLIKGADLLVDGASALAKRFAVSEIVIGLTIVAFGTSTPELIVNLIAAIQDKSAISFGNIIGSNIVNILLILGIAGLIRPLPTAKNTVWREIPFALLAGVVLFIMCNDTLFNRSSDLLSRGDGLILLMFFIIFITYGFAIARVEGVNQTEVKSRSLLKIILYILVGLAALLIGGKLVVDNAVTIARAFSMSEKLIGLTIVAIGTSLPELFTSAVAAKKGNTDIAIGNIVGSNIFNIFFILALTALVRPLEYDRVLNIDLIVLIAASTLLFFTMFTGKKRSLDRGEAVLFLVALIGYYVFILLRN
jgi:cation:H+ antiporter